VNICVICRKKMICKKTGATAVYSGSHCYSGDIFECPECGNLIMNCAPSSYQDKDILKRKEESDDLYVVDMGGS